MAAKKEEQKQEKRQSSANRPQREDAPKIQRTAPPKREEEETLFSWEAPARPFKPRDKKFWTTAITLAFVFGALLYIIEGLMPVFVIIAFTFLYYIMTTVRPDNIEFKITNYGVRYAGQLTEWPLMIRFWFTKRGEVDMLVIDTINFPGRLELVIDPKDITQIRENMSDYLIEEESSPSGMDRMANWLSKKMPEENTAAK